MVSAKTRVVGLEIATLAEFTNDNTGSLTPDVIARAKLAATAPTMARALCSIEWSESEDDLKVLQCPWCGGTDPTHASHCELDRALTQAGLDSEAREVVRETEYLSDMKRLGIVMPRPRPRLRLVPRPRKEDDDEHS